VNPAPASGSRPVEKYRHPADSMAIWNHYYLAQSVEEALQALAEARGPARLIAGGTDLLLDLQQGRHPPLDLLVDVNAIPEMNRVEERDGRLYIGAAAPLNRLVANPRLAVHAQALVEACNLVGGPQVRNAATLGGNVAHALPAADGSIALLALDAQAELAGRDGRRRVPLAELYLGPGRSALDAGQAASSEAGQAASSEAGQAASSEAGQAASGKAGELLVGFWLALRQPGQASAFRRVMRPQGVALPVLNMAAWLWREGERVADLRIALGPSGPKPFRAVQTEHMLLGQPLDEDALASANEALLGEARFRTSPQRATAEYRRQLADVLLRQVLRAAWERTFPLTPNPSPKRGGEQSPLPKGEGRGEGNQ
jgi:carbon-monoxide dehydrogenase medium subunit